MKDENVIEQPPLMSTSESPYAHIIQEEEDNDGHGGDDHEEGHASYISASSHIANTIMGAGILSIPVVMKYLGLIIGGIFIILIALVTMYSVYLLLRCRDMTGRSGYAMFAKITYGSAGSLFVKVMIIINNIGLCCAYFRIFGETTKTLVQAFVEEDNYLVTNWHNYIYVLIIFFAMMFLIFKESIDSLKSVSFLGVLGITIFVISVIIIYFYKLYNDMLPHFDSSMLWPNAKPLDMAGSLPTIFLAFTFQFNVFPVFFTLKNRTKKEMMKGTIIGAGFCLVIYLISGILGFLMYKDTLSDTVLKEFFSDMKKYRDTDLFMKVILIIVNIAFVISSTMSIPLMFFSLKKNFINSVIFCKKKFTRGYSPVSQSANSDCPVSSNYECKNEANNSMLSVPQITQQSSMISYATKLIIILSLYILICVITIVVPELKLIFNIVGSTAANSISFILPNLFYLKLSSMGKVDNSRILPTILLIIGVVILIVCLIAEIVRVIY